MLAVCSATYRRRVEGDEEPNQGRGVAWEGKLIYQHIYNAASQTRKFIPVLLGDATQGDIPLPLQGASHHRPEEPAGYEALYQTLMGVSRVPKGQLGAARALRPGGAVPRRRIPWVAALLVAAAAGGIWLWNRGPTEYEIQVSVVDPSGKPAAGAQVSVSVPAAVMRSAAGWTVRIPRRSIPDNRKAWIAAEAPEFLEGRQELELRSQTRMATTITLGARPVARVGGVVMDAAQHAVAGARVTIVGQGEAAVTGADGGFSLPAHAAAGQVVQLRVEKAGYTPVLQGHPAGSTAAVVIIDR